MNKFLLTYLWCHFLVPCNIHFQNNSHFVHSSYFFLSLTLCSGLQHSWYFFEGLVKSMAHYLIEHGKVKVDLLLKLFVLKPFSYKRDSSKSFLFLVFPSYVQVSRNQRFSASYYHAVETLVNMLMPHITQKYKDNLDAARNANHSLAVFIKVATSWLF